MSISTMIDNLVLACPMCMSGAEGRGVLAANSAILFLLVVLVGVLMAFFSFIIYLAKRAKRFSAEQAVEAVSVEERR